LNFIAIKILRGYSWDCKQEVPFRSTFLRVDMLVGVLYAPPDRFSMDLLRSLPLGLYLEQPQTWMHRLDPRVKFGWLMTILAVPMLANVPWRLGVVGLLIALTVTARVPARVWKQQIGWLLVLCVYVGVLVLFVPDGLNANHQLRQPPDEFAFQRQSATVPPAPKVKPWYNPFASDSAPAPGMITPKLKQPTDYNYVLFKQGKFLVSRRSLDLSLRFSTLMFTLIYGTSLFLLTTASEEITAGLEDLMAPLRRFRVPVTEIALTLTLSLRFIPLVLEEFQNLVRSIRTRAIDWKKLGFKRTVNIWMLVAERLLDNLLLRAEQIASAMQVRGFTTPDTHRVEWHQLRLRWVDWTALGVMGLLWVARIVWGGQAA
jgi:energy-coupling factor transport system permease protein